MVKVARPAKEGRVAAMVAKARMAPASRPVAAKAAKNKWLQISVAVAVVSRAASRAASKAASKAASLDSKAVNKEGSRVVSKAASKVVPQVVNPVHRVG